MEEEEEKIYDETNRYLKLKETVAVLIINLPDKFFFFSFFHSNDSLFPFLRHYLLNADKLQEAHNIVLSAIICSYDDDDEK